MIQLYFFPNDKTRYSITTSCKQTVTIANYHSQTEIFKSSSLPPPTQKKKHTHITNLPCVSLCPLSFPIIFPYPIGVAPLRPCGVLVPVPPPPCALLRPHASPRPLRPSAAHARLLRPPLVSIQDRLDPTKWWVLYNFKQKYPGNIQEIHFYHLRPFESIQEISKYHQISTLQQL